MQRAEPHTADAPALLARLRGRKCVLFGTGSAAGEFLTRCPLSVAFAVDNDHRRWDQMFRGIEIKPPTALQQVDPTEYAVVIASSAVEPILRQLEGLGFGGSDNILVSPFIQRTVTLPAATQLLVSCFGEGGGLFVVRPEQKSFERVYSGGCRGLVRQGDNYLIADEERGLVRLSADFKVQQVLQLDPLINIHGLCVDAAHDRVLVLETANDAIGVYDGGTLALVRRHHVARSKAPTADEHHVNHLLVHDGRLYASMFSLNGVWRREIWNDGAIVELDPENFSVIRVLMHGLSQPHSIHFVGDQLYYCNSMEFEVRTGDRPFFRGNGYTRGLTSQGTTFFIGQSRVRRLTRYQERFLAISRDTGINIHDAQSRTFTFLALRAEGLFDILVL